MNERSFLCFRNGFSVVALRFDEPVRFANVQLTNVQYQPTGGNGEIATWNWSGPPILCTVAAKRRTKCNIFGVRSTRTLDTNLRRHIYTALYLDFEDIVSCSSPGSKFGGPRIRFPFFNWQRQADTKIVLQHVKELLNIADWKTTIFVCSCCENMTYQVYSTSAIYLQNFFILVSFHSLFISNIPTLTVITKILV